MLSQILSDETAGFGKTDVKFLVRKKSMILPGSTELLWSKSSEDVQRPDQYCRSAANWSSIVPEKECAQLWRSSCPTCSSLCWPHDLPCHLVKCRKSSNRSSAQKMRTRSSRWLYVPQSSQLKAIDYDDPPLLHITTLRWNCYTNHQRERRNPLYVSQLHFLQLFGPPKRLSTNQTTRCHPHVAYISRLRN